MENKILFKTLRLHDHFSDRNLKKKKEKFGKIKEKNTFISQLAHLQMFPRNSQPSVENFNPWWICLFLHLRNSVTCSSLHRGNTDYRRSWSFSKGFPSLFYIDTYTRCNWKKKEKGAEKMIEDPSIMLKKNQTVCRGIYPLC